MGMIHYLAYQRLKGVKVAAMCETQRERLRPLGRRLMSLVTDYVAKRGNTVYLLGLTCEREIYRTVNEEAKTIIMSVDFDPPADTTQGAAAGASGQ